jgi:hypothetical protein
MDDSSYITSFDNTTPRETFLSLRLSDVENQFSIGFQKSSAMREVCKLMISGIEYPKKY